MTITITADSGETTDLTQQEWNTLVSFMRRWYPNLQPLDEERTLDSLFVKITWIDLEMRKP